MSDLLSESEVKQLVRQHWGGRAEHFDEATNHGIHSVEQRQCWLDTLKRLFGTQPLQVLDLGCGTGFLSLLFAELGHRVTGIDFAPEMLSLARQKAEQAKLAVDFRSGDAENPDLSNESCDLVVARHLIWTLPNPAKAVREWQRVLHTGGRIALFEGHHGEQRILPGYDQIHTQLPFYGGQYGEQLAQFFQDQHLADINIEPMMEPTLWGFEPERPRYAVIGTRGE